MTDKEKQVKPKTKQKDTCIDFKKLMKKQNPLRPSLLNMIALEIEMNERNKQFR